MFQFVRKRTKFSNDKTIQILVLLSLLRVMMFEMTNYTRDFLGNRLLRFGHLVPLANRFVLQTDSDQSEQLLTSAAVFCCKLMPVIQQHIRIVGEAHFSLHCQKLTVLFVHIANGRQESTLVNQILDVAFRTVMILPRLMGGFRLATHRALLMRR